MSQAAVHRLAGDAGHSRGCAQPCSPSAHREGEKGARHRMIPCFFTRFIRGGDELPWCAMIYLHSLVERRHARRRLHVRRRR